MEVVKPERFFHERFGLSDGALERVLGTALERRADWADLYFEFRVNQTASLEEGMVKKATRNVSQGVGVRVVAGARSGYAHSDEVSLERLELAARTARAIADEHSATAALPATRAAAAASRAATGVGGASCSTPCSTAAPSASHARRPGRRSPTWRPRTRPRAR